MSGETYASNLEQTGNAALFGGQILLAFIGLWALSIALGWLIYHIFLPDSLNTEPFVPNRLISWAIPGLNTLPYIIYLLQKVLEEDHMGWTRPLQAVILRALAMVTVVWLGLLVGCVIVRNIKQGCLALKERVRKWNVQCEDSTRDYTTLSLEDQELENGRREESASSYGP